MASFFKKLTQFFLLTLVVVGTLVSSSLYSMKRKRDEKRDEKLFNTLVDVTGNDSITLTQLKSINQITYEKSKKNNILCGNNLCGLFATYNGLKMLTAIEQSNEPKFSQRITDEIKLFNMWLEQGEVKQIVDANRKRNVEETQNGIIAYFNTGEIEDLVRLLRNGKDNNISVIGSNLFEIRKNNPNLLGNNVFENINRFRTEYAPQLILWVCDNHWIPIVLTTTEIWVMDSWKNTARTNCSKVVGINDFFRSEKIPNAEERKALGRNSNLKSENVQKQEPQKIALSLDDSSTDDDQEIQQPPAKKQKINPSIQSQPLQSNSQSVCVMKDESEEETDDRGCIIL